MNTEMSCVPFSSTLVHMKSRAFIVTTAVMLLFFHESSALIACGGLTLPQSEQESVADCVVYTFKLDSDRDNGNAFGDMLIERDGDRFVYRFWAFDQQRNDVDRSPAPPPLLAACGFDAESFWLVLYSEVDTSLRSSAIGDESKSWQLNPDVECKVFVAKAITLFEGTRQALPGRFGTNPKNAFLQIAVLHYLGDRIGASENDISEINKSIRDTMKELGLSTHEYHVWCEFSEQPSNSYWTALIQADDKEFPIKRARLNYGLGWFGAWTLWFPPAYVIERNEEALSASTDSFDYRTYDNGNSRLVQLEANK